MIDSERASQCEPTKPLTPFQQHYRSALALLESGNAEKAAKKFLQAAIADPEKWNNTASEIAKLGHPDVAIAALREVIRLHKGRKDVLAASWCSIGNVLYDEGQTADALEHFLISWSHFHTGGASANIALMNMRLGNLDEARKWIGVSLEINHWNTEAQMIQADLNFQQGNYRTAFRQYECRWRARSSGLKKIQSHKPEWAGESSSKHLLVVGEQGMGDVILVLRYAKLIHALGLTQTWVIHPPLVSLAKTMAIPHADFLTPADPLPDYDCHIASGSLPRALNTSLENIPSAPYLPSVAIHRALALPKQVGICWRGSSANHNDRIRSTNLSQWESILKLPNLDFHSLQFGSGEDNLKSYPSIITHPRPEDWMETAALVSRMSMIISVDTAIVHLAGAMGIPCFCALHCRPYFVYPLCRADTPWYPSVKLFKQKREHEWKDVFDSIAQTIKTLL